MFRGLREWLVTPRLDWLQVEISSRCNAACTYCPHTLYADAWQGRLLDIALFERLKPVLRKTGLVHLQGWGEPFLHPEFFRFVAIARAQGCHVSTTTNGILLDEDRCRRLIEEQVAVVGFSLVGTDAGNDRIRQGTSLTQVLARIDCLHRLKQQAGSVLPAIHVAYLLLRSQITQLRQLPALLRDRGIAQVVISTLDLVGNRSLAGESLPNSPDDARQVRTILNEVRHKGEEASLTIHYRLPTPPQGRAAADPQTKACCSENVERAAVITAAGQVAPCVFTSMPVPLGTQLLENGIERNFQPIFFGSLNDRDFAGIWRTPAYEGFRRAHRSSALPVPCRHCNKMNIIQIDRTRITETIDICPST